ncbi:type II secretion system protein M [Vibrio cincinnatiensis]|uniref:type II secretion system protein M n=1 Tax=Vibrio cincinnatiensis TaxID=675 RepID=UPI0012ACC6F9|nr:type II secretion system protein M [Vibrio cincinnatiensis]MCG3725826.1 type II secretion system protein M [Vibrio cincinnatiensis]MCG3732759.1 type II secretion system protein M [Vibrio cincinnatiensis]MCG3740091.1 type II secretion system protein M [Vibrio cincinnatiensis]MCG3743593.1 type II secretion system protein M [Vibrio cincinnatiensis]MCG3747221.1 type II secretion system protein M [Vibrio cincinnatiensis]
MKQKLTSFVLWWQGISLREQQLLLIGGGAVLLGLLYWGIFAPLSQQSAAAKVRMNSEKQLLQWVESTADQIVSLRQQGGGVYSTQPLNQVIASSTGQFKIELVRVQPRGDRMQVWIQPVPFSQLIAWLAHLKERQGIDVEFMDLERGKVSGVVEVRRLQFKRVG